MKPRTPRLLFLMGLFLLCSLFFSRQVVAQQGTDRKESSAATVAPEVSAAQNVPKSQDSSVLDQINDALHETLSGAIVVVEKARTAVATSVTSDPQGNLQFDHRSSNYQIHAQNGPSQSQIKIVYKDDQNETVQITLQIPH